MSSRKAKQAPPTNDEIAAALQQVANLLESHGANPFRVRAYRAASEIIGGLQESLADLLERDGLKGLLRIPRIGVSLSHSLQHFIESGRLPLLERLSGKDVAETLFSTVPDIGPKLAHRIHEQLGIETLAELRAASMDGRLAHVPGMGAKRLRAVRESLAARFANVDRIGTASKLPIDTSVPVAELLNVDREYRESASLRKLPRIAPQRFNPTGENWLPVLHTHRGDRHYTAMFSNTARAHEMGTTHDWVVIFRDDADGHGRWTIITATFGPLMGRRVVAGRESECAVHYQVGDIAAPGS